MISLKAALATVHRDRGWWHKVLVGGALSLTVLGFPIVEGHQIESIENTQNGYPTPLPRWNDLLGKAIQGVFALVIDFFYFLFPLFFGGLVLVCSTLALGLIGSDGAPVRVLGSVVGGLLLGWLAIVWISSASPLGKRLYVSEGQPNQALSSKVLRDAWQAPARSLYLQARIMSLPVYLLPGALMYASWRSVDVSGWLGLLLLWLGLSALLYARLVVIQLYDAAAREVQRLRFEAFRARTRG